MTYLIDTAWFRVSAINLVKSASQVHRFRQLRKERARRIKKHRIRAVLLDVDQSWLVELRSGSERFHSEQTSKCSVKNK
jgi:hypothetical protein